MPEIESVFAPHHRDLVYELEHSGFVQEPDSRSWQGEVSDGCSSWPVQICLDDPYPVRPPAVRLVDDEGPLGWHQNPDRTMCLYENTLPVWAPWFTKGDLLGRIAIWCRNKDRGWPDDRPDLDLQRYWPRCERYQLAIHAPIPANSRGTSTFELILHTRTLREVGGAGRPGRSASKNLKAIVTDIGELTSPVATPEQLFALMPDAESVMRRIEAGRNPLLLVRYTRRGHAASLLLRAARQGAEIEWTAIETAEDSEAVNDLRRGPYLLPLAAKKVAIVGVGAVGSFVATCLHRAGLTQLTLIDHDILRPGNLARHAADARWVGFSKSDAMVRTLGGPPVQGRHERITSLANAQQLVRTHDLVIDATADEGTTTLLALAAEESTKQIITVYLANQGRSRVVEVLHSPISNRASTTEMDPIGIDGYEAGCGEPVSPTPLYSVQEAAAMASRVAIAALLGAPATNEVRENP